MESAALPKQVAGQFGLWNSSCIFPASHPTACRLWRSLPAQLPASSEHPASDQDAMGAKTAVS